MMLSPQQQQHRKNYITNHFAISMCVVLLKMISWVGFLLRRCTWTVLVQLFVPFKEARLDCEPMICDFILLLPPLHKSRSIGILLWTL
jgi:hypothetical protein